MREGPERTRSRAPTRRPRREARGKGTRQSAREKSACARVNLYLCLLRASARCGSGGGSAEQITSRRGKAQGARARRSKWLIHLKRYTAHSSASSLLLLLPTSAAVGLHVVGRRAPSLAVLSANSTHERDASGAAAAAEAEATSQSSPLPLPQPPFCSRARIAIRARHDVHERSILDD